MMHRWKNFPCGWGCLCLRFPRPSGVTLRQRFLWGYIFLLSRRLRLHLIFFEAKARREQVKALQFFDMADHCSLVHAEFAGYGGIGRRTVMGSCSGAVG